MKTIENTKEQFLVKLQPVGRRIQISKDESILEAARLAGVDITSICGGVGVCDSCRVKLIQGKLSPPTLEEQDTFTQQEFNDGFRLACQAYPESDVIIDIPPESLTTPQRLQVESQYQDLLINPEIEIHLLEINPPSLGDLRSDYGRLTDALQPTNSNLSLEYPVLQNLSKSLRDSNWRVKAIINDHSIIAIHPQSESSPVLGLAVDIGTTKVAAFLIDLETGVVLARAGIMNPQIAFGEDVISRISYVIAHPEDDSNNGRKLLQSRIIDGVNSLISTMLSEINNPSLSSSHIVDAVIVGNTAMHHLFAGLQVTQLGLSPYVSSVSEPIKLRSRDLGLNIAPGSFVYLPPNIAGYVGADHVAMLLATLFQYKHELAYTDQNIIAIDIGTNTEISLLHKKNIYSCSTASGPAFEGAHILFGMRAAPGAIEKVQIKPDGKILYKTIADSPPVGICGSGILDAIAELYYQGILDEKGSFDRTHPLVKTDNNQTKFELVPSSISGHNNAIVLTRRDINEIQLAKGAIRAGIEILLQEAGITADDLDQFIVAGAFGTYIDIRNSIRIGMFPDIPLEKCHQVGNAAGTGARQMLLSKTYRKIAEKVAREINYIELSNHPRFTEEFSRALFFPKK
jgi:uncharacterized 2Fe-2S/4Fe-4S cluster protein (DUF4445 family)